MYTLYTNCKNQYSGLKTQESLCALDPHPSINSRSRASVEET